MTDSKPILTMSVVFCKGTYTLMLQSQALDIDPHRRHYKTPQEVLDELTDFATEVTDALTDYPPS